MIRPENKIFSTKIDKITKTLISRKGAKAQRDFLRINTLNLRSLRLCVRHWLLPVCNYSQKEVMKWPFGED
jgi:hypothetical protein